MPVRDGARTLPALLASLAAQTLGRERFEVVVVSNGSRDATARIACDWGARVVEDGTPNRARARNLGVEAATAERLAFTDADCVASPGWLKALTGCPGALAAGPVRIRTPDPPGAVARFERLWRFAQAAWVQDGWAATANLCVRRDVLTAVGGFDAAYGYGEDVDFCLRAGALGHRIAWCPDAVVHHDADRSVWPFLVRSYRHGYGTVQVLERRGFGYRAWRDPRPLLGDGALVAVGARRERFDAREWRRMRRLARAGYAARMAGSLAADARRLRR